MLPYFRPVADDLVAVAAAAGLRVQSIQRHTTIFSVNNFDAASVAAYFADIDEALDLLQTTGVRVVVMPDNTADARAVLYRAWLKGMAGKNPNVESNPEFPYVWVAGRAWTSNDLLVPPQFDPCNASCLEVVKLAVEVTYNTRSSDRAAVVCIISPWLMRGW